jgi:hypothetical protein
MRTLPLPSLLLLVALPLAVQAEDPMAGAIIDKCVQDMQKIKEHWIKKASIYGSHSQQIANHVAKDRFDLALATWERWTSRLHPGESAALAGIVDIREQCLADLDTADPPPTEAELNFLLFIDQSARNDIRYATGCAHSELGTALGGI